MDATPAVHPTDQTLQSYGLGRLDDASAESVNEHLEGCSDCRRRVAELSSDSFLGRLRDAKARPESLRPAVSSTDGLSMLDRAAVMPAPPPASSLPPGLADLPNYEILRELGQGGMGVVYLAQNTLMARMEVLKVVSGHLVNRRGVLDRFLGEIRNAARLHHPNIVAAYTAIQLGESLVLAMEYVEGLDLSRLVKAKGPLPVANACNYIHQAAIGLQHAHERGMVHRDIKPSNLMLSRQGNRPVVKVLDFGLAKVQSEGAVDGGLTHEGQMLGTPDYIAPEQISNARRADIRADIYSLGCTLYYLLTGKPPFQGASLYDILQAHHSMEATPLNLLRPEVPVEVAAIVSKMMAKEPERRFQEPKAIAQALKPFFERGKSAYKSPEPDVSHAWRASTARRTDGTASEPTPPATDARKTAAGSKTPTGASAADSRWEGLIDFREEEPESVPSLVPRPAGRPPRLIAAASLFGLILLGVIIIITIRDRSGKQTGKVILPEGSTATVEVSPEGAAAKTDGAAAARDQRRSRTAFEQAGDAHPPRPPKPGKVPKPEKVPGTIDGPRPSSPPGKIDEATRAILSKLKESIELRFPDGTSLEAVLKYIKTVTGKRYNDWGIPIDVNYVRLSEVEKSLTSTVRIDGTYPLKTAFELIVDQLGLAYCVKDGLLFISTEQGIKEEQEDTADVLLDGSRESLAIAAKLDMPTALGYSDEKPLEAIFEDIRKQTQGTNDPGIQPHFDMLGFQRANRNLGMLVWVDTKGAPLRTTIRVVLNRVKLAYCVRNGVLIISDRQGIERQRTNAESDRRAATSNPEKVPGIAEPDRQNAPGAGATLRTRNGRGQAMIADPFQPGSVWSGTRTYPPNAYKGGTVSYFLHIRERNGPNFIGHKFDNGANRNRNEVAGEIQGDSIIWYDLRDGRSDASWWKHRGIIEGDQIRFRFEAPNNQDPANVGSGTLTRSSP